MPSVGAADRARDAFRVPLPRQVLSGMLLLGGAAAHALDKSTLAFTYIGLEGVAGWLLFLAARPPGRARE